MRGVVTIAMLGLLGGMVLAGPAPGLAASSGSELRAKKACGKTDVGHTRASVRARNVKCSTARKVVRRFVHKYPGREAEESATRRRRIRSGRCRTRPEQLIAAIHTVAAGDALLSPSVTRRVIDRMAAQPLVGEAADPRLEELTPREREVLGLIAQGLSNPEIAAALTVEETTVKTHVKRVLLKTGARDRVHAVILAYESGIVTPGRT